MKHVALEDDVFRNDSRADREYFERDLTRHPVPQLPKGILRSAHANLETGSPQKRDFADPQHTYPASACVFVAK